MTNRAYYAPHVYLAQKQQDSPLYDLFVIIPHFEGETITKIIEMMGGIAQIVYQIEGTGTEKESWYFDKQPLNTQNLTGPLVDKTVEVVCVHAGENKKTIMYFDQTDVVDMSDAVRASLCPHVYLGIPQAVASDSSVPANRVIFDPYCVVPMLPDWGLRDQGVKNIPDSYAYFIEIQDINPMESPYILCNELSINAATYVDTGTIEGYMEAEVRFGKPPKKRKARIRNADSDTNPNVFIDNNPLEKKSS